MSQPDRLTLVDRLRAIADLLTVFDDLPAPYITAGDYSDGRSYADLQWFIQLNTHDHAEQKALAMRIIRAIGGKWDKVPGNTFRFERMRDGLKLRVTVEREAVCERVVTGTTKVTVPAKPAEPARVVEHEVVEWRCEPLLAEVAS